MKAVQCGCCDREFPESQIDGLYGVCGRCAFEHSLDHWPCDHGAEYEREFLGVDRSTSPEHK